jgi:hypothetical protein
MKKIVGIAPSVASAESQEGLAAARAAPEVSKLARATAELDVAQREAKGWGLSGTSTTALASAKKAEQAAKDVSQVEKAGAAAGKGAGAVEDVGKVASIVSKIPGATKALDIASKITGKVALPLTAVTGLIAALSSKGSLQKKIEAGVEAIDPTSLLGLIPGLGFLSQGVSGLAFNQGAAYLYGSKAHTQAVMQAARPRLGRQMGGYMGQPTSVDQIPAMLALGEGVLNRTAMANLGVPGLNAMNAGQPLPAGEIHYAQPIVLKIDGRVLANTVVQQTLKRGVFGPSSLVGGQLVTGGY